MNLTVSNVRLLIKTEESQKHQAGNKWHKRCAVPGCSTKDQTPTTTCVSFHRVPHGPKKPKSFKQLRDRKRYAISLKRNSLYHQRLGLCTTTSLHQKWFCNKHKMRTEEIEIQFVHCDKFHRFFTQMEIPIPMSFEAASKPTLDKDALKNSSSGLEHRCVGVPS